MDFSSAELATTGGLRHCVLILLRFLERLVNTEARRLLSWRKLLEGLEKLPDDCLRGHEEKRAISTPFSVEHRGVFGGSFERIRPQVEYIRGP